MAQIPRQRNELPQVGVVMYMYRYTHNTEFQAGFSTNQATEAAQVAALNSPIQIKAKHLNLMNR
jgi:hypothetical protein